MIHTAELHKRISAEEYKKISAHPEVKMERNSFGGKSSPHIRALAQYGITDISIKRYTIRSTGKVIYMCAVIINLKRIINGGHHTVKTYMDPKEYDILKREFAGYIGLILPNHMNLDEWIPYRIDYNIDLLLTEDEVPRYITLLQRGDKGGSWKVHETLIEREKRRKNKRGIDSINHPRGSVLFDTGQYSINIYDKHFERIHDQTRRGVSNPEELEECKGILRLEVQAKSGYLRYLRKKYGLKALNLHDMANYDLAEYSVMRVLDIIAGRSDYYSFNKAEEIIRANVIRHRRDEIISFLKSVSSHRSLWKAKRDYKNKIKLRYILDKLKSLNINPVTIPRDYKSNKMVDLHDIAAIAFAELKGVYHNV